MGRAEPTSGVMKNVWEEVQGTSGISCASKVNTQATASINFACPFNSIQFNSIPFNSIQFNSIQFNSNYFRFHVFMPSSTAKDVLDMETSSFFVNRYI